MRWATVVLVVLGVGLAAPARADSDADKAARLFKEGRDAVAAGKLDEACAKFAASYKLDAAIGTKLNLADCLEQKGQIAAAYKLFDEAAVEAAKGGKEGRESFARQRADKLVKQLVQVEIVVAEPDTEGMTVVVGGAIVVKKEWSAPRVLAPGKIRVNVSAPGRVPFETAIDGHAGEVRKVEVPALAKAETATGARTGTGTDTGAGTGTGTDTGAGPGTGTGGGGDGGPAPEGKRPSRKLAYVVGGGGVVLLGTSLALGLAAKSKFDGAECGTSAGLPDGVCTDAGQKTTNSARRLADIGTGVAIAGAVAVGVGVWLFVRARHHHAASDHVVVSPTVSDDGVGVVVTWSR